MASDVLYNRALDRAQAAGGSLAGATACDHSHALLLEGTEAVGSHSRFHADHRCCLAPRSALLQLLLLSLEK